MFLFSATRPTTAPSVARTRNYGRMCLVWEHASAEGSTFLGRKTSAAILVYFKLSTLSNRRKNDVKTKTGNLKVFLSLQYMHVGRVRRAPSLFHQLRVWGHVQSDSVLPIRFSFHQAGPTSLRTLNIKKSTKIRLGKNCLAIL
jgi:hypothetical protein